MNRRLVSQCFVGLAIFLSAGSLAFAQHGGHGGGHGGHGGHGGFAGHVGGHSYGHYGGYSGIGHHGYGHHGYGHDGYGHHGGHIGFGGHIDYGHHGISHIDLGHGVHLGVGHDGHHALGHYGHHFYPHFDFYVTPWYGGYGYTTYLYPYYSYYDFGPITSTPADAAQIHPDSTPQVVARPTTTSPGEAYRRQAEEAFRAGKFDEAARLANHALVEMPRDGKLLLFAAQTLFAIGDYRGAAAAVHQAAPLLDPSEWGYVVENYRQYYRGRAYVEQMDRLNQFIKENPEEAYAYFLRGYQYGFLGHTEAALRDLKKAFRLESRDKLASQLIQRFGGTPPANNSPDDGPVPPVIEGDSHEGHDHGSHEHRDNSPTSAGGEGGNRSHDRGDAPVVTRSPAALPLVEDENVPPAVDDQSEPVPPPSGPKADQVVLAGLSKLAPADRAAALAQQSCPVTGDLLGADGPPIKVQLGDRSVFVCCASCVKEVKSAPERFLAD